MKIACPKCSSRIPKDSYVCSICGAVLAFDVEKDTARLIGIICQSCGYQNEPGTYQCQDCSKAYTCMCPRCNAQVSIKENKCRDCGLQVANFFEFEEERQEKIHQAKKVRRRKAQRFSTFSFLLFGILSFYLSVLKYLEADFPFAYGFLLIGLLFLGYSSLGLFEGSARSKVNRELFLLGKKIEIEISSLSSEREQEIYRRKVETSIKLLNKIKKRLNEKEIRIIKNVSKITVDGRNGSAVNSDLAVFNIGKGALNVESSAEIAARIAHVADHIEQKRKSLGGWKFNVFDDVEAEKHAIAFQLQIGRKLQLPEAYIEYLEEVMKDPKYQKIPYEKQCW